MQVRSAGTPAPAEQEGGGDEDTPMQLSATDQFTTPPSTVEKRSSGRLEAMKAKSLKY